MRAHILVITAVLSTTLASAGEPEPQTREEVDEVFESLDRNEDERISKSEAQRKADLRERFAGVDASGDGYLSRSEYHSRPTDEPFE